MIWMLEVVGVSVLLSVLLVRLVRLTGHKPEIPPPQTIRQSAVAFCVFRLLIDQREEFYLRAALPEPEFCMVQRKRLWLAMRCLVSVGRNATLLAATGQRAALSGDLNLGQRSELPAISSRQLKVNLLAAEFAVLVKWLFPTSPLRLRLATLKVQQMIPSLPGR